MKTLKWVNIETLILPHKVCTFESILYQSSLGIIGGDNLVAVFIFLKNSCHFDSYICLFLILKNKEN